jgi:hypothetical protein
MGFNVVSITKFVSLTVGLPGLQHEYKINIEIKINVEACFILGSYSSQRSSIAAVGELTNCPPGTEAKLIDKS